MKTILRILVVSNLLFIASLHSFAQIKESENGYVVPTEGTLRILLIYAQVDYSVGGCPSPGDTYACNYGTNTAWPNPTAPNCSIPLECAPPNWETVSGTYGYPFFDPDNIVFNDRTLSDYYHQGSLNELYLLGDYISISIPCTASNLGSSYYGAKAVFDYLDAYSTRLKRRMANIYLILTCMIATQKGCIKIQQATLVII